MCREQEKKLSALEMEVAAAKKEGFISKFTKVNEDTGKKKLLAVMGIATQFGRRKNREAIRKAWMPTGNRIFCL